MSRTARIEFIGGPSDGCVEYIPLSAVNDDKGINLIALGVDLVGQYRADYARRTYVWQGWV